MSAVPAMKGLLTVVGLMLSVPASTELFVFESLNGRLTLRAHVPRQNFIVLKAEAQGRTLIVSEKSQREEEWRVRLHVFPAADIGGH